MGDLVRSLRWAWYDKLVGLATADPLSFLYHPKIKTRIRRADSTQHAAQGERISNSDQLNQLMESIACGHVFMEPQQQVGYV